MKLERYAKNPVISPNDNWWEKTAVFNAASVVLNGKICLLYRAIGEDNLSRLALAISDDGYTFERFNLPVFEGDATIEWERLGVEDPRIAVIGGEMYVTYVAASVYPMDQAPPAWSNGAPWRTRVCLAKTSDLRKFQRLGVILPDSDNKDVVIFPEKIKGRWALLHREFPNIWIAYSDDLINWTDHKALMEPQPGKWDCNRLGAGATPIKTELGWLEFYHGVDDNKRYAMGVSLHALEDPEKIIARSPEPLLEPEEWYELEGLVPNVCFSCGVVEKDGLYLVYYGAADKYVGVATIGVDQMMSYLGSLMQRS